MISTAVAAPALPPVSPLAAITPIPFWRLLRVEWRKQFDTRAARWLLATSFLLTFLAAVIAVWRSNDIEQTLRGYLEIIVLGATIALPIITILTLTTEWTRRTVLVTFTQEPRRMRVTAAKVLAGLGLAAVTTAVVFGAAYGGLALSDGLGRTVTWDLPAKQALGVVLVVLFSVLMAIGFGALLQNTPAAIVLYLVLPTMFTLLAVALKDLGQWLDTAVTFEWLLAGDWGSGHTPKILTSIGVWVVAPLVAGLIRTARREVS